MQRKLVIPEGTRRTFAVRVRDRLGAYVNLTGMKVYFYGHDLAEGVDDGTNRISKDSVAGGVTIVDAANGLIQVHIIPTDVELTEADEDIVEGVWGVRWENSAGSNDTDEYSYEQPLVLTRNRMRAS